jgi:hypothetical protein
MNLIKFSHCLLLGRLIDRSDINVLFIECTLDFSLYELRVLCCYVEVNRKWLLQLLVQWVRRVINDCLRGD